MLSHGRIGASHAGQWEPGNTMLSSRGSRWMHTLRKLPTRLPKRKAIAVVMRGSSLYRRPDRYVIAGKRSSPSSLPPAGQTAAPHGLRVPTDECHQASAFLARKIISQNPTYCRSSMVQPDSVKRWARSARV